MSRYRPHADVVSRQIEQEAVILDLATGEYFGLNETGARIWELLEAHDEQGIAVQLAEEFDVSAAEAAEAVRDLLASLLERRLIEQVDDALA
ncbi:MAG: PqqD family protein [Acidobacteriota bacterium]